MRPAQLRRWTLAILCGLCGFASVARAGGPLIFNEADGRLFPWLDNRAVYFAETGRLGNLSNEIATAAVEKSFKNWTDVATADLRVENLDGIVLPEKLAPFKKDITAEDFTVESCTLPVPDGNTTTFVEFRIFCELERTCLEQEDATNCLSPVIFDEDGSITASLFGENSGTLGFTGALLFTLPDSSVGPHTVQAFTVLNGAAFDQNPNNSFADDPDGTRYLEAVVTHEFGHFLGLGHSSANGDIARLNPAVTTVGATQTQPSNPSALSSAPPVDSLVTVEASEVERMYPILLTDADNRVPPPFIKTDDESTLSTIYPCTADGVAKGRCKRDLAQTGTISGHVFIPSGGQLTNAQGVLVIARRMDDNGEGASALTGVVAQITGSTFAPRRCNGTVFTDTNGNGQLDSDEAAVAFTGLFGSCSTVDDPQTPNVDEGEVECKELLKNFLGGSFVGSCGFFSSSFSNPREIGKDAAENSFTLTGLSPGTYIVQAASLFDGSYSSPVRATFGLILSLKPAILSDDNSVPAFFPNPQIGEFYNGPAGGCGASTADCGNETASAADNPFAFTPIQVTAGKPVENVNIFLNTPERGFFRDPGFDFCGLGDVDGNGIVEEKDILAVVQAKEKGVVNRHTDLNADGIISSADVDIITDIVALPQPFVFEASDSELKRGLAPFEAICQAAAGKCSLSAPAEEIGADGKPTAELCQSAKDNGGCQVVGCP